MIPKFRAWNNYHDEMILWDELLCEPYNRMEDFNDGTLEFMQSTGLHDKHGVEIFEGDIVEYTWDSPKDINASEKGKIKRFGRIFWSEIRGSWALGTRNLNEELFRYARADRAKIIGNIYANPELLEDV